MPRLDPQEQASAYEAVYAPGPVAQVNPIVPVPPATIAAGSGYSSGVLYADGFRSLSVGATSSQAGQMSVTRFLDAAGLIQVGPAAAVTLAAGAPGYVAITDGVPFAAFVVTITNTGTALATVSNFGVLLNGG